MNLFLQSGARPTGKMHQNHLSDRVPVTNITPPYAVAKYSPSDVLYMACCILIHYMVHIRCFVGISFRSFSALLVDLGQDPAAQAMSALNPYAVEGGETYSLSRKRWYSVSPTLTGDPPYCSSRVSIHPILRASFHLTYLRNEDLVASSDAHGHALAILVNAAGADSQHLGFVELFDRRLGQEDAAGSLGLGLDALHEHAVEEGDKGLDGAERGGLVRDTVSIVSVYSDVRMGGRARRIGLVKKLWRGNRALLSSNCIMDRVGNLPF